MSKTSRYTSRQPNARGLIDYTEEEHGIWHDLITRQIPMLQGRACKQWISVLDEMNFSIDRIPQLPEINKVLEKHTGWNVVPVKSLIPFTEFFGLLANKQFPVATFIRTREEFDYLQEPDVFHELFGHAPVLTDRRFAAFIEAYGKAGLAADPRDHAMLARLFWFTVEFGLVDNGEGIRAYGAGIMSSPGELVHAVESPLPRRKPLQPVEALRTPYRIDIYQTVYFVLDTFDHLFELAQADWSKFIGEARRLGMHAPTYPPKEAA